MPTREELLREELSLLEEEERLLSAESPEVAPVASGPAQAAASGPGKGLMGTLANIALGIQPLGVGPSVQDIGETVGNIPSSGMSMIRGIGELVSNPGQVSETLRKGLFGAPEAAARAVLPESVASDMIGGHNPSEGSKIASALASEMFGRYMPDRLGKTIKEDPVGTALDMSVVFPLLRRLGSIGRVLPKVAEAGEGAGKLERAGRAALSAAVEAEGNPIKGLANAGKRVARDIPAKARGIAEDVFGATTGKGRKVFTESFEAGLEGGERQAALRAGRSGAIGAEQVANDVVDGFKKLKGKRDVDFRDKIGKIFTEQRGTSLDIRGIRSDIPDILREFGIKPKVDAKGKFNGILTSRSGIVAGSAEQRQVERAINLMLNQRDADPQALFATKRQLDKLAGKAKMLANTDASAVIGKLRDRIRAELGKVPGFNEASGAFAADTRMLEQMQKSLSIQGQTNETLMTKLTNLFNDRENLGLRQRMIGELEEATGKPLKAQIAGLRTADPFSGGMTGALIRGGSLLGVGGAGMSGSVGGVIGFLSLLPFTSPKLMGRFMEALGQGRKATQGVERAMEGIHAMIPPGMVTDGLTVGMVIKRLTDSAEEQAAQQDEQGPPPPSAGSLMGALGRIGATRLGRQPVP